ncbi:HAD-IA family hydrolase [Candidatus Bathyarchaeota archaeon]|nr:HAD-IA family hydrolase [Candidatus Bathyarchaeota archaeon]
MTRIRLAVFDMAGTTVDDLVDGVPLVLKSYSDAFTAHGVHVPMEVLNEQRGRDKWTVISELGGEEAEAIYEDFLGILNANTGRVKEVDGASETFRFLRECGVIVYASTGFPAEVAEAIVAHLGWAESGLIDGWVCSEQVAASRPDPAMILYAMKKHGITSPGEVLKVDDTAKGIEEGLNAGAHTVGVLTGTQSIQRLGAAGPHTILKSIRELLAYLEGKRLV